MTKQALLVSALVAVCLVAPAQAAKKGAKAPPPAVRPAPVEATPTPGSTITALPTANSAQRPAVSTPSLQVAARAVFITGVVTIGQGEGARALAAGDPVYEQQTLYVGPNSYANLKFEDGGRVLLRPDSEFAIESYRYVPAPAPAAAAAPAKAAPVPAEGARGTAFFRLVRGGFRAISGLIGKADRQAYRVTTPAATIGIRGTDYEVQLCGDDCPAQAQASAGAGTEVAARELAGLELAQAGDAGRGGVVVATHEGSISLHTSRGEFVVDAGKVALAMWNGQTFMLPVVPDLMLRSPMPSPEACH